MENSNAFARPSRRLLTTFSQNCVLSGGGDISANGCVEQRDRPRDAVLCNRQLLFTLPSSAHALQLRCQYTVISCPGNTQSRRDECRRQQTAAPPIRRR